MPSQNLQAPEGCNEFNIWYGKWIGEQWKERKELVASQTRCSVRRDAGRTNAETRYPLMVARRPKFNISKKPFMPTFFNSQCKPSQGSRPARGRHGEAAYSCLFFARGCCALGKECTFLHRRSPPSSSSAGMPPAHPPTPPARILQEPASPSPLPPAPPPLPQSPRCPVRRPPRPAEPRVRPRAGSSGALRP